MARLGVNIDHVATVRQARRTYEPDPVWAAAEAILGGADGITFHLREDRRHINDRDAELLKQTVTVKLNMEMAIARPIVAVALRLRPDQCTLVPERREELTTEGGLDVARLRRRIAPVVDRLRAAGIEVSAFIEPVAGQVRASAEVGCQAVEFWTGGYAHARGRAVSREIRRLADAMKVGQDAGLLIHAGHGLNYHNVSALVAMGGFVEFNIGHSIVSRAVFVGLREAVRQMKALV
ncbi:MAG: pyridoxine 5'-phosphate synthase [Phycisphaerae bacterium]|jgi:pyridoxine 5-phosphate synthase